ncbi:GIY-YIG nuclease family protein [Sphingomonas sp. MMS24-JH45]
MQLAWVYIMTDEPSGTLYVGVTAHLSARVMRRRDGRGSEFCDKHGLTRLVYVERHDTIADAIAREKALKKWKRGWKLNLIGKANPDWDDLWQSINM